MAQQRTARLAGAEYVNANTRLLEFRTEDELGFVGGQYIIVHTGVPIGEGKTAKRAYSLLSSDEQQRRFQLAVRRIEIGPDTFGPGSNYMHELPIGAELAFSGPWGKFLPPDSLPEDAVEPSILVLATDTGITAALGLVNSNKFIPHCRQANIFWLAGPEDYFLSELFVRERIAAAGLNVEIVRIPVDIERRDEWLRINRDALVRKMLEPRPATAYLSGDGFLLAEFRDALTQAEAESPTICVETFFHHQELKSSAKTAAV